MTTPKEWHERHHNVRLAAVTGNFKYVKRYIEELESKVKQPYKDIRVGVDTERSED